MSKIVSGIKTDQLYPINQTKLISPDLIYNIGIQATTIVSPSLTTYSTPIASLYIENAPLSGANITVIAPAYSLYVASGNCYLGGNVDINMGRITSYIAPNANRFSESMELQYVSPQGYVAAYDRKNGYYTKLYLHNTIYITGSGGANGTGYVGINKSNPSTTLDVNGLTQSQSLVVNSTLPVSPTSGKGLEVYYYNNKGNITSITRSTSTLLNVTLNDSFIVNSSYVTGTLLKITKNSMYINLLYFGRATIGNSTQSYADFTITHNLGVLALVILQMQTGATNWSDQLAVCVTGIANNSFTIKVCRFDATGWGGPHYVNWIGII